MEFGFVSRQQCVDERLVGVFVHRAVQVGFLLFLGFAFVIAGLHPCFGHVDAVCIDDWGDGIEECQRLGAGFIRDCLTQTLRGQGACRNDPVTVVGQVGDFFVRRADQRVIHQGLGHGFRKRIAVNSQRTTCGQAMIIGGRDDQATCGAHFPMQQADSVLFVVIRPERIGTNHFAEVARLVGKGFDLGAHFVDDHGHTHLCGLPCGLGSGHSAADDMKRFCHARADSVSALHCHGVC